MTPPAPTGSVPTTALARKIRDLTGPGHSERYGVGGTDLGVPRLSPDGSRLVVVFGDTFEHPGIGGPGWRTPVALFADPDGVGDGLRWTGSAGDGDYAAQLVPAPHNSTLRGSFVTTQLPTDVISVEGSMFLHVMACEGLGHVHFTELYRSDDQGDTWHTTGCWWPGDHLDGMFQMLTLEEGDDGYVYVVSTGFQRDKPLILQRVPADRLTDPSAWEPWGWQADTGWQWGQRATPVLDGRWGEVCLRRLEDRWVLSGFDAGNYRIDARYLTGPTDDLHTAPRSTVAQGCAWDEEDHDAGKVAQLYGGYLVPGSTAAEQHYVVSQWNTTTNWPYRAMQFRLSGTAVGDGRPGGPDQSGIVSPRAT